MVSNGNRDALGNGIRALATIAVALGGISPCVRAASFVELGPSDGLALDQPRVAIEVIDHEPGEEPVSLGPDFSNTLLLDTAANGILVVGSAVSELQQAGYETEAVYEEQGIAGTALMNVSASYRLDFAGDSGVRNTLPDIRIMSNQTLNFGSFNGILGMPGMVNRVTTLDMTVFPFCDFALMGVDFSAAVPPGGGHRHRIALELIPFAQEGQQHPEDPLPTWAPIPSAPVTLTHGDTLLGRRFIVDTGAQVSIVDSATAFALGLDEDGSGTFDEEKLFDLPIGGIGGTIDAPVLATDSVALVSQDGVQLTWTDFQFAVLDIHPTIAGVLGMDLLTSGWLNKLFCASTDDGYIERVHFDFLDADQLAGNMVLDLNSERGEIFSEPSTGDLDWSGITDFDDIDGMVVALKRPDQYSLQHGFHPLIQGDMNGDGELDFDDLNPFVNRLRAAGADGTARVPEPGGWPLALLGSLLLAAFFRVRAAFC